MSTNSVMCTYVRSLCNLLITSCTVEWQKLCLRGRSLLIESTFCTQLKNDFQFFKKLKCFLLILDSQKLYFDITQTSLGENTFFFFRRNDFVCFSQVFRFMIILRNWKDPDKLLRFVEPILVFASRSWMWKQKRKKYSSKSWGELNKQTRNKWTGIFLFYLKSKLRFHTGGICLFNLHLPVTGEFDYAFLVQAKSRVLVPPAVPF